MKTIGIVAEFNPFHNGHSYLIEKAKEITKADNVVVVMSGNYVQRGEPAFMDKFSRTITALENGVDLVIELPFCYASSSANYFATGAISLLNSLGIVSNLCFGCEYDNLDLLNSIADVIVDEDTVYSDALQSYLKTGMSFAKSRENAIIKSLALRGVMMESTSLSNILSKPNTILAIEYLIALKNTDSLMVPVAIKRENNNTSQDMIHSSLTSAHSIRQLFYGKSVYNFNNIKTSLLSSVPENSIEMLESEYKKTYPVDINDYSAIIGNSLIKAKYDSDNIDDLFDSTIDISNRLLNNLDHFIDTKAFINKVNSPTYTSSRIQRILLYNLFNYKKEDFFNFKENGYVFYIRVLGFNKEKERLLTEINDNSDLPIITKISTSLSSLNPYGKKMLELNMFADEVYRMITMNKYNINIPNEHKQGVIVASEFDIKPDTDLV